ncbi:MAG: asparagine synthase (glutamine-hydrolyzing) [Pseudomonadota bacterium]
MCGFAGVFYADRSRRLGPDSKLIEVMMDSLVHRGPDAGGSYRNHQVGLGHRRLSILDIAGGSQPMTNAEHTVSLVFNGEIFNYLELRADLLKRGYEFRTQSDTEVVAQMYARHGTSFVEHLNGQFSIVLWDHREKRLVMARDRVGICPLYYREESDRLIFASELKALLPAMESSPSICPEALDEVFTFWTAIAPRTLLEGVVELEPGHIAVADEKGLSVRKYWDWTFPEHNEDFERDEPMLLQELEALLSDATALRLRSDVPVGAYLSGGLDSSALVQLAGRHAGERLSTFSLSFSDQTFDESVYQQRLVRALKVTHHEIRVTQRDIASAFMASMRHIEMPVLRTAPIAMGLLSKFVREQGFKVVLTGEGADETLGGYDIFKEGKARRFWAKFPESSFRPLILKRLYPYLDLPKSGAADYLKRFFGGGLTAVDDPRYSHLPRWATTSRIKQFYSDEFAAATQAAAPASNRLLDKYHNALNRLHPFNQAQYVEAKMLMSGYLLSSQGDRMLMMNSVEGRFPFLDHRLIEFSNRVHPNLKMKVMNEKYLLKKCMAEHLPGEILSRPKQPYRAPDIDVSAETGLGEVVEELLGPEAVSRCGVFDPRKVGFLRAKAQSGRKLTVNDSQSLMGIMSTHAAHQNFVEIGREQDVNVRSR